MHATEREAMILAVMEPKGFITYRELETRLSASPATIRRDLARLALKIEIAVACLETTMHLSFPSLIQLQRHNGSLAISHIPEVRPMALERGVGPGRPNAVVMGVVGGIVIRHHTSRWCQDRMKVSSAAVDGFDIPPQWGGGELVVFHHWTLPNGEQNVRALKNRIALGGGFRGLSLQLQSAVGGGVGLQVI